MRRVLLSWLAAAAFDVLSLAGDFAEAAVTVTGNTSPVYSGADPWNVSSLTVGNTAAGNMTINGGSDVVVTNSITIASSVAASTSTVSISGVGSTLSAGSHLYVGDAGDAILTITSGGAVSNTFGHIGDESTSTSSVTIGGGTGASTWTMSASLYVAGSGSSTLNITGGGSVSNDEGYLGGGLASGDGTATVGGGAGAST